MSVPGSALGGLGADSTIQQILARGKANDAQTADAESQFKASQDREAQARTAQAAALKPLQEKERTMLGQAPQAPDTAKLPEAPTAPQIDSKEMSETLSLIMGLAAVGGALTRQPLTAALNSFSQGVHGFVQGKQEVYQNQVKEFDTHLQKAKAENDATWKKYQAAREKYGTDIAGLQSEMQLIAAETQNPIDIELAKRGDLVSLMKLHETANNNFDKVMTSVAKVKEASQAHADAVQQHKDAEKDRMAIAAQASADRRSIAHQASADRRYNTDFAHADRQASVAARGAGGAAGNVRSKIVQGAATNAMNRLNELKGDDGQFPTVSVMFGQHGDGVIGRGMHAVGQATLSTEQQKIDADYGSLVDEAIPVFTGGLRGSDTYRKFLLGQLPQPGDDPETANEKMRVLEANIQGNLNTFSGVAKMPGMTQGAAASPAAASPGGPLTFATEADAEKAGLAPGTKVVVGGVPGTWH